MIKINIRNMKKYYGNRLVLNIEELKIYEGDKIGIVGVNGVGKTTLLEIINKNIEYDSGDVLINKDANIKYISQLRGPNKKTISGKYASIFQIEDQWNINMSGGEKTRFKLAEGFESESNLMLIDEPTSNLDINGIELIINNFKQYRGTLLVVSHDRNFLDEICNKILEIEDGQCNIYNGNYSNYLELKEKEVKRKEFEYEEFLREKKRLTNLKRNINEKSAKVRTAPSRMGNSEARLHKMGGQENRKKLDNFAKSIQSRIDRLEIKEKPKEEDIIKIKILDSTKPYNKILVSGKNINKSYGENIIFKNANFDIYNGKKIALIGPNGSGKTTLVNMILNEEGIDISKNVRIGYFSQSMDILDENKTILENVMEKSIHNESFARLILARLLIKGDKVYENLEVLSGGERVKVSFAKMILEDINFLILDEPTNYLDINSLVVIEDLLINYDGTILLVSHDLRFIENIAEELLIIKNKKINSFKGNYREYVANKNKPKLNKKENKRQRMILEMEISLLLSKISTEESEDAKKRLDEKYKEKLEELRNLK
ncbi:ribosomal protection-like ABC-F family protein [Clostridium sp. Cult3]|jgi:macrolide transport system ATP-binding/permease protein|uniref:ribosomal protection-like ABC-F family protein n=1 Tax=Clostridium sp. Cult3 TaxID=2079004 RepID=UPI001F00852B|nr:ABC-F type ribosomal protection protein [Clostridium sp. Cult3]MCF6460664.1 ABC transporter [Clostridium sp. Cult3]